MTVELLGIAAAAAAITLCSGVRTYLTLLTICLLCKAGIHPLYHTFASDFLLSGAGLGIIGTLALLEITDDIVAIPLPGLMLCTTMLRPPAALLCCLSAMDQSKPVLSFGIAIAAGLLVCGPFLLLRRGIYEKLNTPGVKLQYRTSFMQNMMENSAVALSACLAFSLPVWAFFIMLATAVAASYSSIRSSGLKFEASSPMNILLPHTGLRVDEPDIGSLYRRKVHYEPLNGAPPAKQKTSRRL